MAGDPVQVVLISDRFNSYTSTVAERVNGIVTKAVFDTERLAKEPMSGPKHGRVYNRKRGGPHQASAPGEAPAIDEGDLVNSIVGKMTDQTHGEVAVHSAHGVYLEYGTSRMAARPYLHPAVERVRPGYMAAMKQAGAL